MHFLIKKHVKSIVLGQKLTDFGYFFLMSQDFFQQFPKKYEIFVIPEGSFSVQKKTKQNKKTKTNKNNNNNNNNKTLTLFELSYDRMFYRRLNFSKRKNYDFKVARSKQLRYYFSLSQIRRTIYKHHVYEEFTEEYKIENNSTNNKKKLR